MSKINMDELAIVVDDCAKYINNQIRVAIESHGPEFVLNMTVNVATSIAAKGLLLLPPDDRHRIMQMIIETIHGKTREGDEAIEALSKAIRASAGSYTCQPYPPTKH